MRKGECTVVVSSCDKYEDIWEPFFKILKMQWPEREYPIVLNTESKSFDYEDLNIKTFQFYKPGTRVKWGKRLIKTLKHIETEYILFMLEDFFLTDKVDQHRLDECIGWMDSDPNIAVFSFWRGMPPNLKDNKYTNFEKRSQTGEYRLNCQIALWRREKLITFIRTHENPWEWEILGSMRSSRYKEDFYSADRDKPYIFRYDCNSTGLSHDKWKRGTVGLFHRYNIECDFDKRGFVDDKKLKWEYRSYQSVLIKFICDRIVQWKSLR